MDPNRKRWNVGQQKLRRALLAKHPEAIALFLDQHAKVHSGKMTRTELWSFEDEVLNGISEEQIRCIPEGAEHSIAWILFHLARIEDMTMNMLVAGTPQIFVREDWAKRLNVEIFHSGNAMDESSVVIISARIDIYELRAYRQSVGHQTRKIVQKLKPEELNQKVDPLRLQTIMDEGALIPEAIGILNYWSKRTIAGLLLMPPTRHNFLHLNEAARIKQQVSHLPGVTIRAAQRSKVSFGE